MSAFAAVFSDWKVIKTRACVQLVFEVPIEKADEAYQVLGGMPIAGNEVWCAVARLGSPGGEQSRRSDGSGGSQEVAGPTSKKTPAQIAGYLCTLPAFHKFLQEKCQAAWRRNWSATVDKEERAKQCIYDICTVTSRTQLTTDNAEWCALQLAFRLWQDHPELEDA